MREGGASVRSSADVIVIGGGLVGMAIAWGLQKRGLVVLVLDEGDVAHRASRGNFGLVWVQGKGVGMPAYAAWTRRSADRWQGLADRLRQETGLDVGYRKVGGLDIALSEDELSERRAKLEAIRDAADADTRVDFEMLDRRQVAELFPDIGPDVAGGSWTAHDGHASPLLLLRALLAAFRSEGGIYRPETAVHRIEPGFVVHGGREQYSSGRVVIAAGLGSARLAPMVGLDVAVRPQRGQVLVTERLSPRLGYPTVCVRQTVEGTIQIGDSHEEVGSDDRTTPFVLRDIARRAVRTFPFLGQARIVRSWGALRVMSPDGFPIYQQSPDLPGAFSASCHSGVTLAAAHADLIAPMIEAGRLEADVAPFSGQRFARRNPDFA
ncbi:MAG: FAD-binding oxidoreductase [Geminicoccaceae bacterium]|nr:FAD-binding oxidoreductase [Geminicoccaceae bacterium]